MNEFTFVLKQAREIDLESLFYFFQKSPTGELKPQAKFQNPRTTPSRRKKSKNKKRKVTQAESERKE